MAFVAGVELAPLLGKLDGGQTASALLQDWAQTHPPNKCLEVVNWLWEHEVIVASP